MSYNIAIDGPAGAGKSTIAKKLAARLGFVYVDTGAMYRTIALYLLRQGIGPQEEEAIAEAVQKVDVGISYEDGAQQVYLNGENVSSLIRTEEVSQMTSQTSVYLPVREKLVELQKKLAAAENVIMDGRDIGTCVLPNADVKIYMTASVEVRAKRRYLELTQKGAQCSMEEIEREISERDYRDMHREHSPLRQAEDAVLLDTSELTIEQVVDAMEEIAKARGIFAAWK